MAVFLLLVVLVGLVVLLFFSKDVIRLGKHICAKRCERLYDHSADHADSFGFAQSVHVA